MSRTWRQAWSLFCARPVKFVYGDGFFALFSFKPKLKKKTGLLNVGKFNIFSLIMMMTIMLLMMMMMILLLMMMTLLMILQSLE